MENIMADFFFGTNAIEGHASSAQRFVAPEIDYSK